MATTNASASYDVYTVSLPTIPDVTGAGIRWKIGLDYSATQVFEYSNNIRISIGRNQVKN